MGVIRIILQSFQEGGGILPIRGGSEGNFTFLGVLGVNLACAAIFHGMRS